MVPHREAPFLPCGPHAGSSWLCVGGGIKGLSLRLSKKAKNALGDGWIKPQKQHRRDDPIAAKHSTVPWDSRIGVNPVADPRHQHIKVSGRPPADLVEEFV